MTLTWITLGAILTWIIGIAIEYVLIHHAHTTTAHATPDTTICGACHRDLTNWRNATHAGGVDEAIYLTNIAVQWPIYRTRQLLEVLHLAKRRPRHDGPCDLDRDQATAAT